MKNIKGLFLLGLMLPLGCLKAQSDKKMCLVESVEYPGKDLSMWDALYAAKSGVVYTGLITEGVSAHFYSYSPLQNKNTLLFDIAAFEGERGKGIRTSGKIHNKPVEDDSGNIYFVPLNNGSGPRKIDFTSWPGGYWMKYNSATGILENLGLVDEGTGCYPLVINQQNTFLFGVDFTGHLYRFDLKKRITKNFGRVSNWDVGRTIFSDDEGNVYGSFPIGRVWKYDAKKEKIIDLSVRIPYDPTFFPVELINPMIDRTCDWRTIEWDPVEKVAYGVTTGSGSLLFKYDPHIGEEGAVTLLERLCDSKFLETGRKDVPFSTLAFALDSKKKRIYFVPSAREYDLQHAAESFGTIEPSHLVVYDIKAGKRLDLGELHTKEGARVFGCEAASVGPDGTLFICGQVEVKDPSKATTYIGSTPVSIQLIIYKPMGH